MTKNPYYYVKNLQGDVIAILNSGNIPVAEYAYDAWGNILSVTDGNGNAVSLSADHIANINPIRYRSYYYDTETMFYYLQSRYYDPYLGRFINADGYMTTGQGFEGYNMYMYCLNNPISRIDLLGTISCNCVYDGSMCDFRRLESNLAPRNCPHQKDITEMLDEAMRDHASDLQQHYEEYGFESAALYFASNEVSGGEWDLKSQESWNLQPNYTYYYNDEVLRFDDIGNIHYGYVGRVLFNEKILLFAGGVVQIFDKSSKLEYWNTHFDDPRDQWAISYGSNLWDLEADS